MCCNDMNSQKDNHKSELGFKKDLVVAIATLKIMFTNLHKNGITCIVFKCKRGHLIETILYHCMICTTFSEKYENVFIEFCNFLCKTFHPSFLRVFISRMAPGNKQGKTFMIIAYYLIPLRFNR